MGTTVAGRIARFLIALVMISLLALPLSAWASETTNTLPGPTWAWIGALVIQTVVTAGCTLAVALALESIKSQRETVNGLSVRLAETREQYVSHAQLNTRLAELLGPIRKDLDDLEGQVTTLQDEVKELRGEVAELKAMGTTQSGQLEQILNLLDPRGRR